MPAIVSSPIGKKNQTKKITCIAAIAVCMSCILSWQKSWVELQWPTFLALTLVHNPKGGVLAGYLPTWVGILLAVGGAVMSVCHRYGGVRRVWQVSYSQLANCLCSSDLYQQRGLEIKVCSGVLSTGGYTPTPLLEMATFFGYIDCPSKEGRTASLPTLYPFLANTSTEAQSCHISKGSVMAKTCHRKVTNKNLKYFWIFRL